MKNDGILTHAIPNLERSGYFRNIVPPISLALPPATAIHLNQGTGFVSLTAPTAPGSSLFDIVSGLGDEYDLHGKYDKYDTILRPKTPIFGS